MNLKNMFLRGTLLLTAAGIISRIMGFFYRIFLANTIGAEGMGIYQLIFPIFSVSEASFSFPRAYFAAVNFEIAVSMPEAQREKQTE